MYRLNSDFESVLCFLLTVTYSLDATCFISSFSCSFVITVYDDDSDDSIFRIELNVITSNEIYQLIKKLTRVIPKIAAKNATNLPSIVFG